MGAAVVNRQRSVGIRSERVRKAAMRALAAVGRAGESVEIDVVDDREIRRLNALHRGVRRRTDVLAFTLEIPGISCLPTGGISRLPTGARSGRLLGQIVISAETALRQSRRVGVPLATELDLLVTHGVLHLIGYDDRDPVEAHLMHRREREILSTGRRPPERLWQGLLPL